MMLVAMLMLGLQVFAQRTITGVVTSKEDSSPIPGVSVVVKGTTQGVVTDFDGKYSISVPAGEVSLVFSFVGMQTKEVVTANSSTIDVVMSSEDVGLDEVVVTALGIQREKRSVTYQTERVSGEELLAGQSTRAATGLVGKVAGLQINVQDNGVNPSSQILLRGLRSISASNEALIVIDGSIATTGAFNQLNANDIESISVLKGASAAALYGSTASNGAILVQTKSGRKSSALTVGINHSTTFETVAYMPDFQTEHGTGWDGKYDNIENTNWGPRFDGTVRQIGPTFADGSYQAVPYAPVQDNLKDFYNRGQSMQNTVYFMGGDKSSSYYMSIGNQSTTGIVPDDEYSRYTFRVNASKSLGKMEFKVNSSFVTDDMNVVGSSIGDQDRPLYWFVLNTPANIPLSTYKDWDNPASYGYADNYYNAYYQNPYWAIGTNRNMDKSKRVIANLSAKWNILSNVDFTTRLGVNSVYGNGKNWRAYQTYNEDLQPYHSTVSSFVEDSEFQTSTYTGDALLSGSFDLTTDIQLKAVLGAAVYAYDYRYSRLRANNLSIPDFYDVSNGTGELDGVVDESMKRTVGAFADFSIGYKNWAFLSLTGRQDYTSTLPAGQNGYFYPAVGLSVVLTDAIAALNDHPILTLAKVTASNSTVYNDLSPFQLNERYSQATGFPFGTVNGFSKAATAVDANIKKEKLNSTEIGANLEFLKGRFVFDASYFITKTTDLITSTTPSYASASSSYLTNIGKLKGSGYELSLGAEVFEVGDFRWNINLNYYKYETIVEEIKDNLNEIAVETWTGYGTYAVKGEAFPQLKAVAFVRDPDGRVVIDASSGNPVIGDVENMGKTTPDFIMGLTNMFSFKGLSISGTIDYRGGYVYYAQGSDVMEFTGRSMESVAGDRKDFVWPNSVIETKAATYNEDGEELTPAEYQENTSIQISNGIMGFWQNDYNNIKENYVKDATALKIRELAINYTLPSSMLSSVGFVKRFTVGFVGRNLLTVFPNEKYIFSDPEFRNNSSTDAANGIGVGGYFTSPPTRSLGFNVNIEF